MPDPERQPDPARGLGTEPSPAAQPPASTRPRPDAGEPITPGRDRLRAGRLVVRREAVERQAPASAGTADERFLRRLRAPFTDTDPWRVLRITAEFVEGFDALAEVGPAVSVFGSARRRGGVAPLRDRPRPRRPPGGRRVRGHHRRRPRPDGGGEPRLPRGRRLLDRLQHRAAPRAVAQPVGRPRRRVPLLLRPQDDVREVRRRLRDHARRVRHARRVLRGAHPDPDRQDSALPGLPGRDGVLGRACSTGCARPRWTRGWSTTRTWGCCASPTTWPRSPARCAPSSTPKTASIRDGGLPAKRRVS